MLYGSYYIDISIRSGGDLSPNRWLFSLYFPFLMFLRLLRLVVGMYHVLGV